MASLSLYLIMAASVSLSAFAQPYPIDQGFLEEIYSCNPPCLPDECCIHEYVPDNPIGRRNPDFPSRLKNKRTVSTHCEPLKAEGAECAVQKDVEICPCGRNLVCVPNQGSLGLYFGTCRP